MLDLVRVIAGPSCSQLLAGLGAFDQYLSNGMGKRSAGADLSRVLGTVHTELLPRADVVLLGYRPGALDRFGRPDLPVDQWRHQSLDGYRIRTPCSTLESQPEEGVTVRALL